MPFHGWTDAVLDFYEGLEVDNSRAYWQSHKKVYDEEVRGPMEALLAEPCDEFGDAKMFRPHRDIRFSADKGAGGADRGRPASRHVDDAADRDHRPTVRPPAAEPSVRRARRGLHRRTRATPAPGECPCLAVQRRLPHRHRLVVRRVGHRRPARARGAAHRPDAQRLQDRHPPRGYVWGVPQAAEW